MSSWNMGKKPRTRLASLTVLAVMMNCVFCSFESPSGVAETQSKGQMVQLLDTQFEEFDCLARLANAQEVKVFYS